MDLISLIVVTTILSILVLFSALVLFALRDSSRTKKSQKPGTIWRAKESNRASNDFPYLTSGKKLQSSAAFFQHSRR